MDLLKKLPDMSPERAGAFMEKLASIDEAADKEKDKLLEQTFTDEEKEAILSDAALKIKKELYINAAIRLVICIVTIYLLVSIPATWGGASLIPVTLWFVGTYWSRLLGLHRLPQTMWSPMESLNHDAFLDALLLLVLFWMIGHPPG